MFDQKEFFDYNPSLSSMDTDGYVYVPSGCQEIKKTEGEIHSHNS